MKLQQIQRRLNIAIEQLRVNDNYLLVNDVNERSITHKLALYLDQTFGKKYDVDCEYNKNIDSESGRKAILSKAINSIDENEQKYVYPDIIVHKRGKNTHNLLVIEAKKSTNRTSFDDDLRKLEGYTRQEEADELKYKYGVFIMFYTGQKQFRKPEIIYFENGRRIE